MGATNKPLHIYIDNTIYECNKEAWDALAAQAHTITIISGELPDIYLAPYAQRMTADMLLAMPAALQLAIKGARALRYAPHGKPPVKGKTKSATKAKPHKGCNAQVKAQTTDTPASACSARESTVTGADSETGGIGTTDQNSNNERLI